MAEELTLERYYKFIELRDKFYDEQELVTGQLYDLCRRHYLAFDSGDCNARERCFSSRSPSFSEKFVTFGNCFSDYDFESRAYSIGLELFNPEWLAKLEEQEKIKAEAVKQSRIEAKAKRKEHLKSQLIKLQAELDSLC
jgi:hypothetical protein